MSSYACALLACAMWLSIVLRSAEAATSVDFLAENSINHGTDNDIIPQPALTASSGVTDTLSAGVRGLMAYNQAYTPLPASGVCNDPSFPNICSAAQSCCAQGYICVDSTCKQHTYPLCTKNKNPNPCNGRCCPVGRYCNAYGKCNVRKPFVPISATKDMCTSVDHPTICRQGGICCAQGLVCSTGLCNPPGTHTCKPGSRHPNPCNGNCCPRGMFCSHWGTCIPPSPTCGGTGKKCCSGPKSGRCNQPTAGCYLGKCQLPCGGENEECCNGYRGPELDHSGSSGSRSCNPAKTLTCDNGKCKHCGLKDEVCCIQGGLRCTQSFTTCNYSTNRCVDCGGQNQRCCEAGPPCIDLPTFQCNNAVPRDGLCVQV